MPEAIVDMQDNDLAMSNKAGLIGNIVLITNHCNLKMF